MFLSRLGLKAPKSPFEDEAAISDTSSAQRQSPSPSFHSRSPSALTNFSRKRPSTQAREEKHEFKTYRLVGPYEQPWASDKRMKRTRYSTWIVYVCIFIGFGISAYYCYATWHKAQIFVHEFCMIMDDDFTTQTTINADYWNHEIQINGFGTGSFDWTTDADTNSYIDTNGLHIVPTLTNETTPITIEQISNGYTLNLTTDGSMGGLCTGTGNPNITCAMISNSTLGYTLPPVRSARLNTKGKKGIKYGRVEVVAKMARGDWLWPAIWMMPTDSVYGEWPRSGEIDIAEMKGNAIGYENGGRDTIASTLHWGPTTSLNAWWRTVQGHKIRRTDYTKGYHTFGLEWSRKYIYTYVDNKLMRVLYVDFQDSESLWDRGGFATAEVNQTLIPDPWAGTGNTNTPFDQEFYLILNVAVGSRNGWFIDGVDDKPWVDASSYLAAGSFWASVDEWLPTWGEGPDRGMTVRSVKMWQEGACA